MSFGGEFHKRFDAYVANPIGEILLRLGSIAASVKGGYEIVSALHFNQERPIRTADVLGGVGYITGAVILGGLATMAARHYRGHDHIPPQDS